MKILLVGGPFHHDYLTVPEGTTVHVVPIPPKLSWAMVDLPPEGPGRVARATYHWTPEVAGGWRTFQFQDDA